MKKIINILLVLICALTIFSFFCGCGNSQKHDYSEEEKTIGKQAITYAHQYIKGEMSSDKAYKKLYDLYTKFDDDNELSDEIYKLSLNILYEDVDVSIIEDNIEKIEDLINLSYAYNLDAESILNEDNDKETSSEDETVKETETQAPTVNPKKIEQNYKKHVKILILKH